MRSYLLSLLPAVARGDRWLGCRQPIGATRLESAGLGSLGCSASAAAERHRFRSGGARKGGAEMSVGPLPCIGRLREARDVRGTPSDLRVEGGAEMSAGPLPRILRRGRRGDVRGTRLLTVARGDWLLVYQPVGAARSESAGLGSLGCSASVAAERHGFRSVGYLLPLGLKVPGKQVAGWARGSAYLVQHLLGAGVGEVGSWISRRPRALACCRCCCCLFGALADTQLSFVRVVLPLAERFCH